MLDHPSSGRGREGTVASSSRQFISGPEDEYISFTPPPSSQPAVLPVHPCSIIEEGPVAKPTHPDSGVNLGPIYAYLLHPRFSCVKGGWLGGAPLPAPTPHPHYGPQPSKVVKVPEPHKNDLLVANSISGLQFDPVLSP